MSCVLIGGEVELEWVKYRVEEVKCEDGTYEKLSRFILLMDFGYKYLTLMLLLLEMQVP